jgi:hypothetical protein
MITQRISACSRKYAYVTSGFSLVVARVHGRRLEHHILRATQKRARHLKMKQNQKTCFFLPTKRLWNTEAWAMTGNNHAEEDGIAEPLVNLASSDMLSLGASRGRDQNAACIHGVEVFVSSIHLSRFWF